MSALVKTATGISCNPSSKHTEICKHPKIVLYFLGSTNKLCFLINSQSLNRCLGPKKLKSDFQNSKNLRANCEQLKTCFPSILSWIQNFWETNILPRWAKQQHWMIMYQGFMTLENKIPPLPNKTRANPPPLMSLIISCLYTYQSISVA